MLGWIFSFFTGIGIGLIMGTGIEAAVTMDHGKILRIPECPIQCETYLTNFVIPFDTVHEFSMLILSVIGRGGNEISTGMATVIGRGLEIMVTIGKGKTRTANTREKENTDAEPTDNP